MQRVRMEGDTCNDEREAETRQQEAGSKPDGQEEADSQPQEAESKNDGGQAVDKTQQQKARSKPHGGQEEAEAQPQEAGSKFRGGQEGETQGNTDGGLDDEAGAQLLEELKELERWDVVELRGRLLGCWGASAQRVEPRRVHVGREEDPPLRPRRVSEGLLRLPYLSHERFLDHRRREDLVACHTLYLLGKQMLGLIVLCAALGVKPCKLPLSPLPNETKCSSVSHSKRHSFYN